MIKQITVLKHVMIPHIYGFIASFIIGDVRKYDRPVFLLTAPIFFHAVHCDRPEKNSYFKCWGNPFTDFSGGSETFSQA